MKATRTELLSNCCQAPLKAWSGDEGTGYYECTRCLRAADQMVPSTPAELPSSFEKKWEEVEKAWKGKPIPTWIKEVSKQLFSLGAQEALQRVEKITEDLKWNHTMARGARVDKRYNLALEDVLAKLRAEELKRQKEENEVIQNALLDAVKGHDQRLMEEMGIVLNNRDQHEGAIRILRNLLRKERNDKNSRKNRG